MQRDVRREKERVDAGQHRDRLGRDTGIGEPLLDHGHGGGGRVVGGVLDDPQRAVAGVVGRAGHDLLGDAAAVVAEQRRRAGDDLDRAAIVDPQRMGGCAREQWP